MKKPLIIGTMFIVAGVACIFPFIRSLILENLVVMLGIYLIYRGYLYLTSSILCQNKHKSDKKSGPDDILVEVCPPNCKK